MGLLLTVAGCSTSDFEVDVSAVRAYVPQVWSCVTVASAANLRDDTVPVGVIKVRVDSGTQNSIKSEYYFEGVTMVQQEDWEEYAWTCTVTTDTEAGSLEAKVETFEHNS